MIWPWSEIEKWKKRSEFLQRCLDNSTKTETFAMNEYLKISASMRGAHKGIWRLKQKLKRYEDDQRRKSGGELMITLVDTSQPVEQSKNSVTVEIQVQPGWRVYVYNGMWSHDFKTWVPISNGKVR